MIKPDRAKIEKLLATGLARHRAGDLAEASALYGKILRIAPRHAAALHLQGAIAFDQGRVEEAGELATRALAAKPDFPEALVNLGVVRRIQGRLDEARGCLERALALQPAYPEALNSLGLVFHAQGRLGEAVERYREALRLRPDYPEALNNLGNALSALGDFAAAAGRFRQALAFRPGFADALINLGTAFKEMGRSADAAARYREALAADPESVPALINLGNLRKEQGQAAEAAALYRQALARQPDSPLLLGNLLFALNADDSLGREALFAEHRAFGARHPAPPRPPAPPLVGRRLRLGYVSPDFREHSVAQFLAPVLAAHDRAAVEVFCYAEVMAPDAVTARLQGLAEHWRSSVGLSDAALAERIRADGIDVLIDLAGHTAHNRLGAFALRPAPVQATWLGYPNTTGLPSMDYRLVDAVTDPEGEAPEGEADILATETLIRLPGGFLCYGPPEHAPEPAPPPCLDTGFVTFGSFNTPAKLSESTVALWSELLLALPSARLLLKGQALADAATVALVQERFARHGVAAGRIEAVARIADAAGHLGAYARIDIALDPTPYNGTTTSCEALWMGVPVVTLAGDRHAGRVGASLLSRLGLAELIASDRSGFVGVAAALAADPARLADLRAGLR
ncbi:MAG: tetratricopeptide repeat protein, partial [Rhodospirillaceae bacterium]